LIEVLHRLGIHRTSAPLRWYKMSRALRTDPSARESCLLLCYVGVTPVAGCKG
jgi:hypothetical protein